jgi:hypothetical protein
MRAEFWGHVYVIHSQLGQTPELVLNFSEDHARDRTENANEPPVVDGAALIDHHFTLLPVSGNPSGKRNAQDVVKQA